MEALTEAHLSYVEGPQYGTLTMVGKGGHERTVPVVDPGARAVLGDPERLRAMGSVGYRGHLIRWSKGVRHLGITSKLATPHAVRHTYAVEAYRKSGGNLHLVQELLGHGDPKTTARYLHINLGEAAAALSS